MKLLKNISLALILAISSTTIFAHSMSPGYQKRAAISDVMTFQYKLKNEFDFPVTFKIEVFAKDGETKVDGWKTNRQYFKIATGSTKRLSIKINTSYERKILVCSILDSVGYEQKTPSTITRVCSRLWVWK